MFLSEVTMVVSHILGGIGNQMFQYAVARALSLKNGQRLILDLSDFSDYKLHNGFELSRVFGVAVESAAPSTKREVLGWRGNSLIKKILRRPQFNWLRGKKFIVEPHFNYWPEIFNLDGDVYLYGYWQSERYFKSFESTVREDFTFRERLIGRNLEFSSDIRKLNSISLHIRRGDYVSDKKNIKIMEACSLGYYRKAVEYMAARVVQPVFYIFSDDMDWVRANLSLDFPCVYVNNNHGRDSYRDMQLMSLCRYNIIANSSFSWWGAWLNSNPEKIVIAPRRWFRSGNDVSDLIPNEWVRL